MTVIGGRLPAALRADIDSCGYFPDLIADAMTTALLGEPVVDHLVHHEATFSHDEISRHLSVLVVTPSRFIVGHTDEQEAANGEPPSAVTTVESVALTQIRSVALTQVVAHPERHGAGRSSLQETWLSVHWGTMRRLDLEPAHCGDPNCDADHGYGGTVSADDLTVRLSVAADGRPAVDRLVAFATRLQVATGGGR